MIHICINGKELKQKLSELKSCSLLSHQNICMCCKTLALNICLKCGKCFCEKCGKEHENSKGPLNSEYSEKSLIEINDAQYYCKEHFKKVTHYCRICKKNLCEKECLKGHRHINNESLYKFISKKNQSGYKGSNQTLIELAKLASSLHHCYLNGVAYGKITLNFILNLSLMEQINNFINTNQLIKKNIANATIKNDFKIPKEDIPFVFKSFGCYSFNEYYFDLITEVNIGNIKAYHKLMELKKLYHCLKRYRNPLFFTYIFSLSHSIERGIDELFRLSCRKEIADFPFIILGVKNKLSQLQILYNELELNFELLKKHIFKNSYLFDYELRMKIGNIIASNLVCIYHDKIDNFELKEYLLELSLEDIGLN